MNKLDSLQSKIVFFFNQPTIEPADHCTADGLFSVLYLIRRDIQDCFWGQHIEESEVGEKFESSETSRIFPGILTIFAGIDLLAKFYDGDHKDN